MAVRLSTTNGVPLSSIADKLGKIIGTASEVTQIRWLAMPSPHPDSGVSLDVPNYFQTNAYCCGAVAGWMIVKTFHPNQDARRFYSLCNPTDARGTSTTTLVKALRKTRVGVSLKRKLTFAAMRKAIDSGYPIIACIDRPGENYSHWIVVYGYAMKPDRVYVAGNTSWCRAFGIPLGKSFEIPKRQFENLLVSPALVCWGKRRPSRNRPSRKK